MLIALLGTVRLVLMMLRGRDGMYGHDRDPPKRSKHWRARLNEGRKNRGLLAGVIVATLGFGALALFGWYGGY